MSGADTGWVYSWCQGAGERICDFCQRHTPPPDDCHPVKDFPAPWLAQSDRCPAFVLRPDAVPPPEES